MKVLLDECLPKKLKDKIYFEDDQTTEDTEGNNE